MASLQTWWTEVTARHPRLYAYRHVAAAVSSALLAIIGVAVFVKAFAREMLHAIFGWLPRLRLPNIDLPDLPIPSISLPDVTLPGWLGVVGHVAKYVVPVLIAVVVAQAEIKRRARPADEHKTDHDAKG